MASDQQLREANYIHRGADGEYIEDLGQCGFPPCDFQKIVKDERTGKEYRYCMKLQMPVDDYNSCKYHSDGHWAGLVGQWGELLQEENEARERVSAKPQKQKKHWIIMSIIIGIGILIYMLVK